MEADLYAADEQRWIEAQIAALRTGEIDRLDRPHLIEFLTETTIRDRRELKSRLTTLLIHLLKTQIQPERLTVAWVSTVLEQQSELKTLLASIPSLAQHVPGLLADAYDDAVRQAARETRLQRKRFPEASSWSLDAALAVEPPEPTS